MRTSRDGRDAKALTSSTLITLPSTRPALIVKTSVFSSLFSLMNSYITLAGATASSADTARAVVPLRTGSKPSKPIN